MTAILVLLIVVVGMLALVIITLYSVQAEIANLNHSLYEIFVDKTAVPSGEEDGSTEAAL